MIHSIPVHACVSGGQRFASRDNKSRKKTRHGSITAPRLASLLTLMNLCSVVNRQCTSLKIAATALRLGADKPRGGCLSPFNKTSGAHDSKRKIDEGYSYSERFRMNFKYKAGSRPSEQMRTNTNGRFASVSTNGVANTLRHSLKQVVHSFLFA